MGRRLRLRLSRRDFLPVDGNPLVKTELDRRMYTRLASMALKMGTGLSKAVASRANGDLRGWILAKTPALVDEEEFRYSLSTRIFWIRYGLTDFPKCECGKAIGVRRQVQVARGYPDHCSYACAQHDKAVMARKIETNLERHGVEWWTNPDLGRQTTLARYGVDNYTKTPEYREKQKEGFRRRYGADHNMKTEAGRLEWSKSCKAKSGYDHNWKNPASRDMLRAGCRRRYGADHNMKTEAGKEDLRRAVRRKYGGQYDHVWQVPEVRERSQETCEKLYGGRNPMQCPEIRSKAARRYEYDGKHFDSKPEIAFYVWLKDTCTDFEYQPGVSFEYEFEGKQHLYFPDFKVGSKYVEVKGDHMISESGEWICPWDRSQDGRYRAKQLCAEANGVQVMTSTSYVAYLDYVDQKYGKGWLDKFKMPSDSKSK